MFLLFYLFPSILNLKTDDLHRTLRLIIKKCDVTTRLLLITRGESVIRVFNPLHTVEA